MRLAMALAWDGVRRTARSPIGAIIVLGFLADPLVAAANGPSMSSKSAQVVTVTDKENAGEVVVPKGKLLAVTLPSVPGTGYGWRLAEVDAKSREFVERAQTSPDDSAPGDIWHQPVPFRPRSARSPAPTLDTRQ